MQRTQVRRSRWKIWIYWSGKRDSERGLTQDAKSLPRRSWSFGLLVGRGGGEARSTDEAREKRREERGLSSDVP